MDVRTKQFLRRQEVVRVTGIPTSTMYELIARGDFPASRSRATIVPAQYLPRSE